MIVLDTHSLVFDALAPRRLSRAARAAIEEGDSTHSLACCDISLWEIAMLVAKRRLVIEVDTASFLHQLLTARAIRVLGISPEIAALSQSDELALGGDPVDRLIVATALHHRARLVTSDRALRGREAVPTIW